jgi:hypothetical protein
MVVGVLVVGTSTMPAKILVWAALAALAGAFALAPRPAHAHGDVVTMSGDFQPGTIVVRTGERHLYYVLGRGEAIRYPVGVGRAGKQWSGTSQISGKYLRPAWAPPPEIKHDKPSLPDLIPGQPTELDRPFRVVWLHPHVQRRRQRPYRPRQRRHAGGCAIISTNCRASRHRSCAQSRH